MALTASKMLYEREVTDPDTGEVYKIKILRFSERMMQDRLDFLSRPDAEDKEQSRRGRSKRGRRDNTRPQMQRLRQFNFTRGVKWWNFVYPEKVEVLDEYGNPEVNQETGEVLTKPHPQAGLRIPLTLDAFLDLDSSVSEQILDHIDELNEPVDEMPEVRDENGQVEQEAEHSPTV